MASYGLYTHIASNRRRSVLLLAGLFFLVYVMVYAGALVAEVMLGDASLDWYLRAAWRDLIMALPYATAAAAIWIVIAYKFHQRMIDAVTGAHDVTRQEQPRLWNLLENMCISRGIPMPKLKVMDNPARNAFATGLNQGQYSITVTTGLMKALNDREIEAVLGHELTHIRNGDVRMLVIAVIIAGVIGFFAEMFFRIFFRSSWGTGGGRRSSSSSDSKKGSGGAFAAILIAVALIAVAWFLSIAIRFALSRSREFLADAGAVELTKNPDAMISALRKIESRGEIDGATSAVMEMCIDNPREGLADLFATHPSIDSRIKALQDFAGGHDPGPLPPPGLDEPETEQRDAIDAPTPEQLNPEPVIAPEPVNAPPRPRRSPWGRLPLPGLPGGPWGSR